MKLNLLLFFGTVILAAALTFGWQMTAPAPGHVDEIRQHNAQPLPQFSMETIDGKVYQSRDFAGKTMIINFWASWCAPCVAEFPMLLELAKRHPDSLVLAAISSDNDDAAVNRFIATRLSDKDRDVIAQDNVLIVRDYNSAITFDIFNTAMLPETIIVSPQQKMIRKIVGVDWTLEDVERIIPK